MPNGLRLDDIGPHWEGYARATYGTRFHRVHRKGVRLLARCGEEISLAAKPLVLLEHPPYNGTWCRKCERR